MRDLKSGLCYFAAGFLGLLTLLPVGHAATPTADESSARLYKALLELKHQLPELKVVYLPFSSYALQTLEVEWLPSKSTPNLLIRSEYVSKPRPAAEAHKNGVLTLEQSIYLLNKAPKPCLSTDWELATRTVFTNPQLGPLPFCITLSRELAKVKGSHFSANLLQEGGWSRHLRIRFWSNSTEEARRIFTALKLL